MNVLSSMTESEFKGVPCVFPRHHDEVAFSMRNSKWQLMLRIHKQWIIITPSCHYLLSRAFQADCDSIQMTKEISIASSPAAPPLTCCQITSLVYLPKSAESHQALQMEPHPANVTKARKGKSKRKRYNLPKSDIIGYHQCTQCGVCTFEIAPKVHPM